jgi:catechol 2,3-dioxygenase-like lactoylglutathione lyase family enzyme
MAILESAVVVLRVADVERSVDWYRQALGFQARCFPRQPPYQSALLSRDGAELMLQALAPDESAGPACLVCLRVPQGGLLELQAQLQRVTQVLAGPWQRPYGAAELEIADLDGHRLCFSEALPGSEAIWFAR